MLPTSSIFRLKILLAAPSGHRWRQSEAFNAVENERVPLQRMTTVFLYLEQRCDDTFNEETRALVAGGLAETQRTKELIEKLAMFSYGRPAGGIARVWRRKALRMSQGGS